MYQEAKNRGELSIGLKMMLAMKPRNYILSISIVLLPDVIMCNS